MADEYTRLPSPVHPPKDAKSAPPVPVVLVPGVAEANVADLLQRLTLELWALRKVMCEQNGWPFIDYTGPTGPTGQ